MAKIPGNANKGGDSADHPQICSEPALPISTSSGLTSIVPCSSHVLINIPLLRVLSPQQLHCTVTTLEEHPK
jgi:hypothetical protein